MADLSVHQCVTGRPPAGTTTIREKDQDLHVILGGAYNKKARKTELFRWDHGWNFTGYGVRNSAQAMESSRFRSLPMREPGARHHLPLKLGVAGSYPASPASGGALRLRPEIKSG